jgi:NADH-ubiquinone oxidoreductase chain 6
MINLKSVLQEILILASISSAILVIISKNPVISVIYLISLVLNTALYLIVKGITYIGISYILIYIGAIIVLFLFVIMMINIRLTDILEIGMEYTKNIPLAFTVTGIFLYELFNVLPHYLNTLSLPLAAEPIIVFKEFIVSLTYTINNQIFSLINGTFSATGLQESIVNSDFYITNVTLSDSISSLTFNN